MERWELEKRIEELIERNCREYPYEGTEINKGQLKEDILGLIEYLTRSEQEEGCWL